MKSLFSTLLVLVFVVGNAWAVKVNTDHDSTFDFSTVKSVIWEKGTPAKDELMERRIRVAVEQQLTAKGLTVVENGPADLRLATHVATETEMKQSGGNVGISVSKRTSWGSIGVGGRGNRKINQVKVGTLLIDMHDTASGNLVWRANASDTVEDDSAKMEKKINVAVEKAFKDFPPKRK